MPSGAADHALVLGLAVLGRADADQLDLLELVLADEPARIAPRRARFGAEARGERGQADRLRQVGQDLPATELVRLTSLVGISQRPSVVRKLSSANFGSLSVPNIAASFTSSGGLHSV